MQAVFLSSMGLKLNFNDLVIPLVRLGKKLEPPAIRAFHAHTVAKTQLRSFGLSADIAVSTNSAGVISQFRGLETKFQSPCLSVRAARGKIDDAGCVSFSYSHSR